MQLDAKAKGSRNLLVLSAGTCGPQCPHLLTMSRQVVVPLKGTSMLEELFQPMYFESCFFAMTSQCIATLPPAPGLLLASKKDRKNISTEPLPKASTLQRRKWLEPVPIFDDGGNNEEDDLRPTGRLNVGSKLIAFSWLASEPVAPFPPIPFESPPDC